MWNTVLWYLFTILQSGTHFMVFFTSSYDANNYDSWESLHIKCYATYTSPQTHVIDQGIFKNNLVPNTYYKKISTSVQKLNNSMVLVQSVTSQPFTSLRIHFFLLPCTVSSSNPYIVLIHIQAGYEWLQRHTPYANALCKLKGYLNGALFQNLLLLNLLYFNAWKLEVFLWFQHTGWGGGNTNKNPAHKEQPFNSSL